MNLKYAEWLKRDQFVLSCLKARLSPSASAQVLGLSSLSRVRYGPPTLETLFHQKCQADELKSLKKGTMTI